MRFSSRQVLAALLLGPLAAGCNSSDNLTVPPTTGTLSITTTTTGAEPDADGYLVGVDIAPPQTIGASATVQVENVEMGAHTVQLSGIAPNCAAANNPRSVTVAGGEMATVAFAVTCGATTGGVAVTVATSGPSPDADGYTLTLDGADRGPVAASGSVTLDGLSAGAHAIGLSGIAANCQLQGDNPQTVTTAAGASAPVAFTVVCAAPPANAGSLKITTATGGSDPDANGYKVAVDGGTAQSISVNGSSTMANLAAGSHSVRLSDVAQNCIWQGDNPRSVSVSSGATAEVSFSLTCSATSGTVRVSVTSSGTPPDPDGFTVTLDGNGAKPVTSGGSATFQNVSAGGHMVALSGVASNCSVADGAQRNITVSAGATTEVGFSVTCATATMQWSPMESGTNYDLNAVWGSSGADVFTVGRNPDQSSGQSGIFHYNGQSWSSQFSVSGGLTAIWGSGPSDVFAVGIGNVNGLILHNNGTVWSPMEGVVLSPPGGQTDILYSSVWGSSPSDVYAVGTWVSEGEENALITHYDGSAWSKITLDQEIIRNITDVHGTSATDVWASGYFFPEHGYFILHFDGTNWTEYSVEAEALLTGIWAASPTDVFAVGHGDNSLILHYDGTNWTEMPHPPGGISDIWGNSGSDVYAVGTDLLHYDGTAWTKVSDESGGAVWSNSPDEVFVVGAGGRILHGTR
jgi:hypothetical protein